MENKVIQDRLALLRKKMQEEGIDFYMMPTADFHNSEYVNDYFKVREYFCNFTGSNGTLVFWKDGAGLWTDGSRIGRNDRRTVPYVTGGSSYHRGIPGAEHAAGTDFRI